jgi:DNA repair protein RadC
MNNALKIMDLPESERPQERLIRYGAEVLSNSELLAVILRTGTKKQNVINLSSFLLKERGGLNGLINSTYEELKEIDGIGIVKAAEIMALAEISKRFRSFKSGEDYRISSPKDAADYVMDEMKYLQKEHLRVIMLNTKNMVICSKDVSMGSLNSSIVHPREIYTEAIKRCSASIIICHNHPSGDPTPSLEDINITKRLAECGKIIGIELIDHIVIGYGTYISLKEKGVL